MSSERPTPTGPLAPDLRIVEERVYRGGNIWSYQPAIHLIMDLGVLEGYPSDTIPGFVDGLLEVLPGVGNHSCSRGREGGFGERLREGTWLGHVAEHVALQLQQEAGHDQRRGKTRMVKGRPGVYNVVYGYTDEGVGLSAGRLAVRLVNHLIANDPDFDFSAELDALAQRRQRDLDHVDAVVEILSEAAVLHPLKQVLVRGGHETDVHFDLFVPADGLDRALLDRAQELHLGRRVDGRYFGLNHLDAVIRRELVVLDGQRVEILEDAADVEVAEGAVGITQ